jgi:integral membrane protein (TIGR00529 family)
VLIEVPAIIKILIIFSLMLLAIRREMMLGHVFLIGAIALGFIFGLAPTALLKALLTSLLNPKTMALGVIVSLILVLSHSLEIAGQMERLLNHFKGLLRHAGLNLITFPALIGLLPMPGGAIFSAPMVKNLGAQHQLSSAQLSYVNYWFRHIWEYWWPLYPGILLTTAFTGLDLWVFVLFSFPLTIVALTAGYLPIRKLLHQAAAQPQAGADWHHWQAFLRELLPILIAIILGLGLGTLFSLRFGNAPGTVSKETGLIIALLLAIGWVWRQNHFSMAAKVELLKRPALYKIFYMVAAILVFQGIITTSQAVDAVSQELIRWQIPLYPVTIILPFLVGMVAGITIAFVGTTFPILISLVQALGESHLMLPYMMLALASGFIGVLFSPLHLCLLLSNEYFETSLVDVYRYLLIPCSILWITAGGYFWVLRAFFA